MIYPKEKPVTITFKAHEYQILLAKVKRYDWLNGKRVSFGLLEDENEPYGNGQRWHAERGMLDAAVDSAMEVEKQRKDVVSSSEIADSLHEAIAKQRYMIWVWAMQRGGKKWNKTCLIFEALDRRSAVHAVVVWRAELKASGGATRYIDLRRLKLCK